MYGEMYSSHHTENKEAIKVADVAMDMKKELKRFVAVEKIERKVIKKLTLTFL